MQILDAKPKRQRTQTHTDTQTHTHKHTDRQNLPIIYRSLSSGSISSLYSHKMTGSSRKFSGTGSIFFRCRFQYFFQDQFFPGPVPVLFSRTIFFWDRYRYFFLGPIFSGTGTITFFSRTSFFQYRYHQKGAKFPGPGCHTLLRSCRGLKQ